MAELKTKPNDLSVTDFLKSIEDENRRKDCEAIVKLMKQITKADPKMWGASIVGFGNHRYTYDSGRQNDWFLTGFSPRKNALTLYLNGGFEEQKTLLTQLGRYKTGKSCLYIKNLEDINLKILKTLIEQSVENLK